ncbi:MAG: isoleucine--tRNA ligase [Alphaproteobacteria bacterium]|nr:isoleucine--tRNA ligase [Alphaproteobacteria bacterium]
MFEDLKDPVALEAEVLAFWKEAGIFEKSLARGEGQPEFVFYEGPPTANGTPHNGHVLTRVIKDLFPRYKTMRGYHVRRKAGWDTHGLPVEVEVEKSLGIHGREAIEEYGLEPFSRRCIESVFTYTREWEQLTEGIGFWVNLDEAYVTYHRSYVESVWWALSRLFKKGLLYKSHKVVWWWPQGGTALSAGEVGQGYKEVDDPSVTVRFKVEGEDELYLLAWTTTPWTLPSNTAIAVNPELDYAVVRHGGQRLIVAEALREQVFSGVEGEAELLETRKGSELVGLRYAPIFTFAEPEGGDAFRVIPGDHVTTASGTGLVHTAPAFGEDDFRVAKEHGVGMLQLVGVNGAFIEGTGFLEGRFCKDADRDIIHHLKAEGVLFKRETVRHDYPFCWRADDDPLIQYARPAWFIRTTALNAEALENNASVRWMPEHIKEGRFGDFLRNNVDWALSRERFWGTPLPIWTCEACGHQHAVESAAEIERLNPDAFDPEVDKHLQVHRPWIDRVTLPCSACGGTMNRVTEVIDCWFDSGCMPFAQWGFPHQGVEDFKAQFPADFISEAVDQTRGWFYSLLMISTLLFDDECCAEYDLAPVGFPRPYKRCIVLGLVSDMDGKKESKSKGNYTSPDLVMKGEVVQKVVLDHDLEPGQLGLKEAQVRSLGLSPKELMIAQGKSGERGLQVVTADVRAKDTVHLHPDDAHAIGVSEDVLLKAPFDAPGADAFRWLFYASNPPWSNTRLSLRAIREGQREFLIRLKNVHSFFSIYANIAGFDPNVPAPRPPAERSLLDRWILHELTALNQLVVARMDEFQLYEAARELITFVDGLSNWYVRRSRGRFWGEGPDAEDALYTLHQVLVSLSRLIAPFVPFMADAMHRSLVADKVDGAPESVHLCDYPEPDLALLDPALAEQMALVRELASLGLAARAQVGVRVRQPLSAIEVILAQPEQAAALGPLLELLRDELNVREVRFSEEPERFVDFRVKPNYKALGRRLGKDMKACASQLNRMSGAEVRAQVMAGGLNLELPGGPQVLTEDDVVVEVSPKEHFQAASSPAAVVALYAELDDDLREEGLSREILNRVQGVRKELDLGYTQRILLKVEGDAAVQKAACRYAEHIAKETLTREWILGEVPEGAYVTEDEVDGLRVVLTVVAV